MIELQIEVTPCCGREMYAEKLTLILVLNQGHDLQHYLHAPTAGTVLVYERSVRRIWILTAVCGHAKHLLLASTERH